MKYLRKFETEADKNAWLAGSEFVTPNVVLTEGKVGYNLVDPATLPLHIEAIEDLTISFSKAYEYSKDNKTWSSGTSSTSISANAGEKVYFRNSVAPTYGSGIGKFTISDGTCNVAGNIMSMAYGEAFVGKVTIEKAYQFYELFGGAKNIIDASKLVLPATTLASDCYVYMFVGCTNLVSGPALPATRLAVNCYNSMFRNCKNLKYIKMLATNISAKDCLYDWVYGVSSSGTFVKNSAATWNVTGANGIPSGWTVETASA